MSHVKDNPKLPCRRCKHPAARHRVIPAMNRPDQISHGGIWTPEHIFCNAMDILEDGYGDLETCGCSFYDPMDNLQYLETLI